MTHHSTTTPLHATSIHLQSFIHVLQVGCGADELIDLLLRCVLDPGDAIVDCQPTFGMYAFDTDVSGGRVIAVPRNSDFSLDMEAVLAAVREQKPKVVFLTSPNNPDGSMLPEEDLMKLLAEPVRPNRFPTCSFDIFYRAEC